jgi:hypothetical protein
MHQLDEETEKKNIAYAMPTEKITTTIVANRLVRALGGLLQS